MILRDFVPRPLPRNGVLEELQKTLKRYELPKLEFDHFPDSG